MNMRLIARFGAADPGAWVRILPVGMFERWGRTVEVTTETVAEMARNFGTVPDTTIPVNAEHDAPGGKVADVVEVQPRADGLWARLGNFVGDAARRIAEGAFQYLSPEIVWGPTDFDGAEFKNVLVGLALTNQPYFGKETALFSINGELDGAIDNGGAHMTMQPNNTVQVPESLLERFNAWLDQRISGDAPEPPPAQTPAPGGPTPEEFTALQTQHTELLKQMESAKAETTFNEQAAHFSAGPLADLGEGWGARLARVALGQSTKDDAQAIAERFTALLAQADDNTLGATGHDGDGGGAAPPAAEQFAALVDEKVKNGMSATDAMRAVTRENPKLAGSLAGVPTAEEEED